MDKEAIKYKEELRDWTLQMKEMYKKFEKDIEIELGTERKQTFELLLIDLIKELEEKHDLRMDFSKLYNDSYSVHQEWIRISEELQQVNSRNSDKEIKLQPVPYGKHTLPPLPYNYNALEPYIAEEIMRLHHLEHHQSYVDGLNKAEREMEVARRTGDFDLIKHWEREAAFHGAGHYLHTIFWNVMSPTGGGKPIGEIAKQITKDFGSFEKFKQHFSEAAKNVEGVGWAILVWAPRAHRLEILQAEKHQHLSQWDVIPLLVLDVWEHAYYLQYKNERESYVDNWWNVVNWNHVNERFEKARKVLWQPY